LWKNGGKNPPFLLDKQKIMKTPRTEFAQALHAIATERGLDVEVIIGTIEQAIIAAYRRGVREREEDLEDIELEVKIDPVSGEARIFSWKEDKPEKKKDVTPPGFGRIAAQTAKQVIHQKIREAEKNAIMDEFSGRVGSLISGMVLRFDGQDVRVDLGRTEGIMPATERISNERLLPNQRLTFLLKKMEDGPRGREITLSRSDPDFVKKLFAREVPEISSSNVEIKAIAREAGSRTKLVVFSNQPGIDPVGSCVGQKGVRVQAVTNELGGERVDIIPWSENAEELLKSSLSPAEGLSVTLDEKEKTAKIKVPEDQLSLAIGKDGQNARLAAKLTGWKVEVKGVKTKSKTKEPSKASKVTKQSKKGSKTKDKKGKNSKSAKD
jgi:N utilization substance protein A